MQDFLFVALKEDAEAGGCRIDLNPHNLGTEGEDFTENLFLFRFNYAIVQAKPDGGIIFMADLKFHKVPFFFMAKKIALYFDFFGNNT